MGVPWAEQAFSEEPHPTSSETGTARVNEESDESHHLKHTFSEQHRVDKDKHELVVVGYGRW